MTVPVVIVDPQGRIQSFNPAAVRDLGLTRDSIGTPLKLPAEPTLSSTIGRLVPAAAASGKATGFHTRLHEKETFVQIHPAVPAAGDPANRDVTVSFTGISDILAFSRRLHKVSDQLRLLSRRQRILIESIPSEVAILDSRGQIAAVNRAWRKFVQRSGLTVRKYGIGSDYMDVLREARFLSVRESGGSEEPAEQRTPTRAVPFPFRGAPGACSAFRDLGAGLARVLGQELERFSLDCRIPAVAPETPERWRRVTISAPAGLERGACGAHAVAIHTDVHKEVELSRLVLRQQAALRCVSSALFMVDAAGVIEWANDTCHRMYGFPDGELTGRPASILIENARDQQEFLEVLAACHASGRPHSMEATRFSRGGRPMAVQETITPLFADPPDGYNDASSSSSLAQFVIVHDDVTRNNRYAESQLLYATERDNPTGLWTRQAFHERLRDAVERQTRKRGLLAVLFLDLDRLNDNSDTLAHTGGGDDQMLIEVARRVCGCVPDPSGVGRFGGDELAIYCEDLDGIGQLTAMVEALYRCMDAPVEIASRQVFLSASIGIAVCPRDGTRAEQLIRNAALAMHRVKSEGRRGYFCYDSELEPAAHLRISIERDLNRAIGSNELWVAYQPQFSLRTGELTGVEALLRWNRTAEHAVTIGQVVTIAEEAGLILPIGHWMLKETMSSLQRWHLRGHPIQLAVNLSAVQFHRQDVFGILTGIARRRSLPSWAVKAEITETVLLQNSARSREILHALHGAGYGLVLDDFGTGYSSLTYLQQFPIEALKIDSSFLRGIGQDRQNETIVTGIIQLAHALGQTVIAEGVEDYEQLEFLKRNNCDYAQGFLLGHPMPEAAFEELLLSQAAAAGV